MQSSSIFKFIAISFIQHHLCCLNYLALVGLITCVWLLAVPFRHGERIGFSYLVSQKYTGDSAAIKVLRNSETLKFNVKLGTHRRLIPAHNKGLPPSYYIIAGFVFTTVSVPYLRSEVSVLLPTVLTL